MSRKKFTGKVRRGLLLLCTKAPVVDVLNGQATRADTGVSARELGDARAAEKWILGELKVRKEGPWKEGNDV